MFVRTDLIGSGHGRTLWDHAIAEAARTHDRMLIESDPEAIGFYRAMGAELEVTVEPVSGFTIGRLWYALTGA
jgi:ribosomal protein S18 acetylase RimI-like enzyme